MNRPELLIKPVSHRCNLRCGYCFYRKTEQLYPLPLKVMSPAILERLIAVTMEYADGGPCLFSWQGGEPMLAGLEFFQQVVAWQQKFGRSGQVVSNTIQTNATLINREWVEFFRKYNVFVGVSLDGPLSLHNLYRKDAAGKGSYDLVIQGLRKLQEAGVEFNVLSTMGRATRHNLPETIKFFLSRNLKYLQFIPAVDRQNDKMADFSITPKQYGIFLKELFDFWYNDGAPEFSVRFFDNVLERLLGLKAAACTFLKECGCYLVVEANGDVYPCDFFVDARWKLGNIADTPMELLYQKAREEFGRYKALAPPACQRCAYQFLCQNGCLWFRWVKNGSLTDRDYLCEACRCFLDHAVPRLEKMRDRIMAENAVRWPKV
ncbi:MAG TPA: anaerobic sulfatase maturase [bacterium]|nr:anaerobic sulfatase maturase [bacterium]